MTNDTTMTAATKMTMTATAPRAWRWVRSAGAVLGGMAASAGLALGTDEVLHLVGLFPPINQVTYDAPRFVAATTYRVIYAILGFYLIARLAPTRPWRHVWVAAAIGFVASLAGVVATLTHDMGPLWYPVALAVTTLPCAWMGGALRARQA
jgi:zinc transporter ZupT